MKEIVRSEQTTLFPMKSCFVLGADESQIQEKNYTTVTNNDKKIVLTANCKDCSYVICFLVFTHFFSASLNICNMELVVLIKNPMKYLKHSTCKEKTV